MALAIGGKMIFRVDSREIAWAKELQELTWKSRAARVVEVAHQVGIFERLAKAGATANALARDLGLDRAVCEKILIACAAMELVRREGDPWTLSPKGRATLAPGGPMYQGNILAHGAQVWPFWGDLEAAVRGKKGGSVFSPDGEHGFRSYRDFVLGMHNLAMAGRAASLAARVDLAGKRRLLDVGGGPGTYAVALCERWPGLVATVFDLPEAVAIAEEVIRRFGMSDRVRAVVGDWNTDDFGSGYDAVLMSNILHGPDSEAEIKLDKAYRAMRPGAVLIIQDFLLNRQKTGPLTAALFNIMVGAFSVDELSERVARAGFSDIRSQPMPDDVGVGLVLANKTGATGSSPARALADKPPVAP